MKSMKTTKTLKSMNIHENELWKSRIHSQMLQKLILDRVWEHSGIPCKVRAFLETLPDAARCCHMLSDAARCCQMLPDVARCCQMLPDGAMCCQMLPDAAICYQMLPDAAICCHMLPCAAASEYNTTNTKRRWHLGHLSRRLNQIAARSATVPEVRGTKWSVSKAETCHHLTVLLPHC